jgi:GntR family transcriptional regulator / MocR family aminotransferase
VRSGRLAPGTRLPSSRALARDLGISRGVVFEAYAQLAAEGYLIASQGAPTRVAGWAESERPPVPAGSFEHRVDFDMDPALPDTSAFPREAWARSLRAAIRLAPFDAIADSDPRGLPRVRNELMSYLARVRGAAPEPEHTLVCAGFTAGFASLCRVLHGRGVERIGVEDPGFRQHRLIAERAGLEAVPICVDALGLSVESLSEAGCEVVVVTPAHQFPTGVVLAPERRAALLDWAEERDGLIVEDDYDSELRYDRLAVGALQGLAPERVCQIGSLSKRLAPGLRAGWILSPSWLTGELTYEQGVAAGGTPVFEQLALADFISRGELERHLRRMRLRYRARRASLLSALPGVRPLGVSAGLFASIELPSGVDERVVLREASARGVRVESLSAYASSSSTAGALVVGYASLSDGAVQRGARLVAQAIEVAMP